MIKRRQRGSQNLGHTRVHAGMAIGTLESSATGLSWLAESQSWDPDSSPPPAGGLSMNPVTFQRLMNYLVSHSHTGMGHARSPLTRDTDGLNALATELAHDQAADHVIGPRHSMFDDSMEGW